jgi:hypothetical protein
MNEWAKILNLKWRGYLSIANKISKHQPTATHTPLNIYFSFTFPLFSFHVIPFCYLTPPSSPTLLLLLLPFQRTLVPTSIHRKFFQSRKPHFHFQFSSFWVTKKLIFFFLAVRFFQVHFDFPILIFFLDKLDDDENSLWISILYL